MEILCATEIGAFCAANVKFQPKEKETMTRQFIGTKIVTAYEQEKDGKPGYGVIYADGYTSWSPKATFDAAYVDIGHVAHMPLHQQRVIGEKAELDDKLAKLRAFFVTERFDMLPEDERNRMSRQADAMNAYTDVLTERIAAF